MRFDYKLLLTVLLLCLWQGARSSHIVGGEITFECFGNDTYEIELRLFRDCNGIALPSVADIKVYDGLGNQLTSFTASRGNISPLQVSKAACSSLPPTFCVETAVYTAPPIQLPPSSTGYIFAFQTCCRNANIDNVLSASNVGATISSRAYPAAQCNNSPYFAQNPPLILPSNTPVSVNAGANEPDGDSLYYTLCPVLDENPSSPPFDTVPLITPHHSKYPMPSNPPLSIDPATGIISGTITQQGNYVVGICVYEYDSTGTLLSTVQRDYQFNVIHPWAIFTTLTDSIPPECAGSNTGIAKIDAVGGTPPYTYQWSNGATTDSNSTLNAGQHYVIVTDTQGCADTLDFNFTAKDTLLVHSDSVVHVTCPGGNTGSLYFTIEGGTPPFKTFLDSTEISDPHLTNLSGGNYNLRVTDSNECESLLPFTIEEPENLEIDQLQLLPPTCHSEPYGWANIQATGGTPPYTFAWSSGQAGDSLSIPSGHNRVSVTDSNGCTTDSAFVMPDPPLPVPDISVSPATCPHKPDGRIAISMEGESENNYKYFIDSLAFEEEKDSLTPGMYQLVIADTSGCDLNLEVEVRLKRDYEMVFPNAFSPNNDGINDILEIKGDSICYTNPRLVIFSRWGNQVFETSRPFEEFWDGSAHGRKAKQDVYIWKFQSDHYRNKGVINLLR